MGGMRVKRVRRIACIGECMIELSGWDPAAGTARVAFAGDVLNTAIYLARLLRGSDIEVSFVSAVGTDGFSDRMVAEWEEEGIDCRLVGRRPDRLPGVYAIETDAAGERSFRYWRSESAARTLFAGSKTGPGPGSGSGSGLDELAAFDAIYLSGVTLAVLAPDAREALIERAGALRARGGVVAFDGNYRPVLWPDAATARAAMDRMWAHATIALPSADDEAALSPGCDPGPRLAALGATEIAVKHGAAGPVLWPRTGGTGGHAPAASVIDTTGAGDGFNAGYIAARLAGRDREAAAAAGHALARAVVGHRGAILPRSAFDAIAREIAA